MTHEIKLNHGLVALVDDEDYNWINRFKWHAVKGQHGGYYAHNALHGLMHRAIMENPEGLQIDHIDRNGLNNSRSNLRACSDAQNKFNRDKQSNNRSGYKGVYFDKKKRKFRAQIGVDHKKIRLGFFSTAIDAAEAYNEAALKYHKEFSKINNAKIIDNI